MLVNVWVIYLVADADFYSFDIDGKEPTSHDTYLIF
jgi:hypothetical protein